MAVYIDKFSYKIDEYPKEDFSSFNDTILSLSRSQEQAAEFFKVVIRKLHEDQKNRIDETNKNFYIRLFRDLDAKTKKYITNLLEDYKNSNVSGNLENFAKSIKESFSVDVDKIDSKFESILNFILDEVKSKKIEPIDDIEVIGKKIVYDKLKEIPEDKDKTDSGIKIDKDTQNALENSLDAYRNFNKFKTIYASNQALTEKLINNFVAMNEYVLKKISKQSIFSKYKANYYTRSIKRFQKQDPYVPTIVKARLRKRAQEQDSQKTGKSLNLIYLTTKRLQNIVTFVGKDVILKSIKASSEVIGAFGNKLISFAIDNIKIAFTKTAKFALGPFSFILKLLKGGIFVLKASVVILKGILLTSASIAKTLLKFSISIMKGVFGMAKFIAKNIVKLFSLIRTTKTYNVTKKAFLAFFLTPTGAYILGFAFGFIYKKLQIGYEQTKAWVMDLKHTYLDPYIEAFRELFNDGTLDGIIDLLDEKIGPALDALEDVVGFVTNISTWFDNVWEEVKDGTARFAAGFVGGVVGGVIGGALGTLIGMPHVGAWVGAVIGDYVGGKIYDWCKGYYVTEEDAGASLQRLSAKLSGTSNNKGIQQTSIVYQGNSNYANSKTIVANGVDFSTVGGKTFAGGGLPTVHASLSNNTVKEFLGVKNPEIDGYRIVDKITELAVNEFKESTKKLGQINAHWYDSYSKGDYTEDSWYSAIPMAFGSPNNRISHNSQNGNYQKWIDPYGFKVARAAILIRAGNAFNRHIISFKQYKEILERTGDVDSSIYGMSMKKVMNLRGTSWANIDTTPLVNLFKQKNVNDKDANSIKNVHRGLFWNWNGEEISQLDNGFTANFDVSNTFAGQVTAGFRNEATTAEEKFEHSALLKNQRARLKTLSRDLTKLALSKIKNGAKSQMIGRKIDDVLNGIAFDIFLKHGDTEKTVEMLSDFIARVDKDKEAYLSNTVFKALIANGSLFRTDINDNYLKANNDFGTVSFGDNQGLYETVVPESIEIHDTEDDEDENGENLAHVESQTTDLLSDSLETRRLAERLPKSTTTVVPVVSSRSKEPSPSERENADN